MKAGMLREVIEVYKPVSEIGDFGNIKREYKCVFMTKAAVLHKTGTLENQNGEVVPQFGKEFIVRSYIDIDEQSRIRYRGKFYRVLDVDYNISLNDKKIQAEVINE